MKRDDIIKCKNTYFSDKLCVITEIREVKHTTKNGVTEYIEYTAESIDGLDKISGLLEKDVIKVDKSKDNADFEKEKQKLQDQLKKLES